MKMSNMDEATRLIPKYQNLQEKREFFRSNPKANSNTLELIEKATSGMIYGFYQDSYFSEEVKIKAERAFSELCQKLATIIEVEAKRLEQKIKAL